MGDDNKLVKTLTLFSKMGWLSRPGYSTLMANCLNSRRGGISCSTSEVRSDLSVVYSAKAANGNKKNGNLLPLKKLYISVIS